VKTVEDARLLLAKGADKVAVNSAAVKDPSLLTRLSEEFGRQCIVIAIDAKRRTGVSGTPSKSTPAGTLLASPPSDSRDVLLLSPSGTGNVYSDLGDSWEVIVRSGTQAVEASDAVAWAAEATRLGAGEVLLTSYDRDGTKEGFSLFPFGCLFSFWSTPI